MKTKRKMIIAISAFAMVLLAGVVAVVAVLAASNVTVKSNVSITYTADANVMGKVTAKYQKAGSTEVILFDGTTADKGLFSGTEPDNKTITSADCTETIDKTNNTVTFTFTFTNNSTVADYTAVLKLTGASAKADGVIMTYKIDAGAETETTDLSSLVSFDVPANTASPKTVVFTVKLDPNETLRDCSFAGDLSWILSATRSE